VMADPFVLALPAAHPLADRTRVKLKAVAEDPFVMFSKAGAPLFHARLQELCEQAGFTPRIVQHATQIHTVVGLVGAGLGVAVVPASGRNLHPRNVRFVQLADKTEPVHIALAWRRGHDTPASRSFRRVTQEVVAELSRASPG
jgi:DNA-binding transcriptional LysR family regulator